MSEPNTTPPQNPSSGAPDRTLNTFHDSGPKVPDPEASSSGTIPATRIDDSPPPPPATPAPGNVDVPGYEVLSELGRGGMGVVYKARQRKTNRIVALKMILGSHHANLQDKVRFQIEIEAVARLQHINIVQLHEAGEHDDLPFLSLEFCEAGSLDRLLRNRPLTAYEAAVLVEKLARAMHYAHLRGVVHRDLKPANVLLQPMPGSSGTDAPSDEGSGLMGLEPKITDFGLAKRIDSDSNVSRSGVVMGTPSYMAPEQAAGKVREIGPAADVYALGAILYEMLTGQPPFRGETAFETIRCVLEQEPVPPSRLRPKVPLDLETICLRCLQKDAARRFASAESVAEDCRRFRAGEPIRARPVGRFERAVKWVKRRPMVAALCGLIVLLVVAGLTGITWAHGEALRERDRARQMLAQSEESNRLLIQAQVEQLLTAAPQSVPRILESLKKIDPAAVRPRLQELWDGAAPDKQQQMRAGMALLSPEETKVRMALAEWMVDKDTNLRESLLLARQVLRPYGKELAPWLWQQVADPATAPESQLHALAALAASDPLDARWHTAADAAVAQMVRAESQARRLLWAESFFPVRDDLHAPLVEAFHDETKEQRRGAAEILAVHCADRPEQLTELMADADAEQVAILRKPLERHREQGIELLRAELARPIVPSWRFHPIDPSWTALPKEAVDTIEKAAGMVAERFALCQTLPRENAPALVQAMRKSGYRPVQYRPWNDGTAIKVAAVWRRDGGDFQLVEGLTADELHGADDQWRKQGFLPLDVTSFITPAGLRHTALWSRKGSNVVDAKLYVAQPAEKFQSAWEPLQTDGFIPHTQGHVHFAGTDWNYGVWWKPEQLFDTKLYGYAYLEDGYRTNVASDCYQVEVRQVPGFPLTDFRESLSRQEYEAEVGLLRNPTDANSYFRLGDAWYRLGDYRQAADALTLAIVHATNPNVASHHKLRAICRAALGDKTGAQEDLEEYRRRMGPAADTAYLDALVATYLHDDETGFAHLEQTLTRPGVQSVAIYNAACAYALASKILAHTAADLQSNISLLLGCSNGVMPAVRLRQERGQILARSQRYSDRAIALLRESFARGYKRPDLLRTDPDLVALRSSPAFYQVLNEQHQALRYAAVWHDSSTAESAETHGLNVTDHLERCRRFVAEGYRPAAISVVSIGDGVPAIGASVWHRPVSSPGERVAAARRKANIVIALMQMGDRTSVWPQLKHTPAPDVRSFLVRDLATHGADVHALIERLKIEPDVSVRRALILALGEFTAEQLPAAERARLVPLLLQGYRDDPDPGIHAAIDWLLRNSREGFEPRKIDWGQAAALTRIDDELRTCEPDPSRRWYVNGRGQTYVCFQGPIDFRMGSPGSEPDRKTTETPHRRRIGRSFAVASKAITFEEFQQFQRERPDVRRVVLDTSLPDKDSPIFYVTWFEAAQYCNWLSEKEGIPESEWCYPKHADIRAGMKLEPGYLQRKGYRLPTEAEWEYACRAGSTESHFYGMVPELLPRYAWFLENCHRRAWPVGQKRPNDFGLFDMHGNTRTWGWGPALRTVANDAQSGSVLLDLEDTRVIDNTTSAVICGSTFLCSADIVRSACRYFNPVTGRVAEVGIRPVRTLP